MKFGNSSLERLKTCNQEIVEIMLEAIKTSPIDFGIPKFGGRRTAEEQKRLFEDGASTKDGINKLSKHQSGDAVDVIAYVPSIGGYTYDVRYYYMIAGHVLATANRLGYKVKWGGDWDSDRDLDDQRFDDLVHFELIR